MADWKLGYQINKQSKADKAFSCKTVNNNGVLKIDMGGGIPEGADEMIDGVMAMAADAVSSIDGQDASTPESHAAILRVIGGYCNELADKLTP